MAKAKAKVRPIVTPDVVEADGRLTSESVSLTVYTFDYETSAYTGPMRLGANDADPKNTGTFVLPGNAVTVEPPLYSVGLWPFWINARWQIYQEVEIEPKALSVVEKVKSWLRLK